MNLTDLLRKNDIDPKQVLVFRHRPTEPALNRALPLLASERPELFNAYQQTQGKTLEKVMAGGKARYIASFIGHEAGKALFIGLYSIAGSKPLTARQFWQVPAHIELKEFGMTGLDPEEESRSSVLFFDLGLTDFRADWKGKLVVGWPPPERAWWRWADRNDFPVLAITEDSALDPTVKPWNEIALRWKELSVLPTRYKSVLLQWRGIYYIFDESDHKGYVGSAYGEKNLFGRWSNYEATGDGGNTLLRKRDAKNFQFTILELVSPAADPTDVIRLEANWKDRLHTRAPHGLNDN